MEVIVPDWPAPSNVKALFTTRAGGVSSGAFGSLNLGAHVGDVAVDVEENRRRLRALLPSSPVWLKQVHGSEVIDAALSTSDGLLPSSADASFTTQFDVPCTVLVADCLPVLFCATDGSGVAAAHAGWRGLHLGILECTVAAMKPKAGNIFAWMGPAIGPSAFEVGEDVFKAFTEVTPQDAHAFKPIAGSTQKYFADIYELARLRLRRAGVAEIFGGQFCTVSDADRFFSYRRDGKTGRMGAVIWLE
ncbi:MAG: peptidoglycan editing factor PgeF [Betaproteobacteria bacterium]